MERERDRGASDFMQDCLIVFGQRLLIMQSAKEVWSEKLMDYSKLRVFGCSAYAHIPSDERKKVVSQDVVFDETTMSLNKVKRSREKKDDAEIEATKISLISSDEEAQVEQIEQDAKSDGVEEKEEHQHRSLTSQRVRTPTNKPPAFQKCIALDKPNRNKKKLDRFGLNQDEVNYALNISQGDPTTYREAIASDGRDSWISAMTEEMESLYKNSVWELVPKPKDRKLVGCK
ncbi:unnamed protein product [Prunus armeniaca]